MRSRALSGLAAAVVAAPGPAHAHDAAAGIAGFLRGFTLPATEPAFGIAALAVGLVAVQAFPRRLVTGTLPGLLALAAGVAVARSLRAGLAIEPALLACAAAVAGWAALRGEAGHRGAVTLASTTLVALGAASLPDPGPPVAEVAVTAAGALAIAPCVILALAGAADLARAHGADRALALALRIAASWTAALALLMLALLLRPAAG